MARTGLPRHQRSGRGLFAISATAAAVVVVILVVVVVRLLNPTAAEERRVAAAYLEAVYAGDAASARAEMTVTVRSMVTVDDLGDLVDVLAEAAGPGIVIEIVGAAPAAEDVTVVGYRGTGGANDVEGVVTLVRSQDVWGVQEASYRLPDAPEELRARIRAVTDELNERVADRVGS